MHAAEEIATLDWEMVLATEFFEIVDAQEVNVGRVVPVVREQVRFRGSAGS